MLEYIDLRYKPGNNDLVCEYFVEPNRISIEKAAENIAGESSIGTWTDISTMNPKIAEKLKPTVYSIDKKSGEIKIAYPSELFEAGNMPQILSSIAGNIYGMKLINNLRLQDITFPKKLVKSFPGPEIGIKGIRSLLGVKKRPLCGTIVKPKVGLNAKQHAKVAYDAWVGGLDVVKDDENLSSMTFNKFEDRIIATLEARDKAESETGDKKVYMPNVSAEVDTMIERANFVKDHGGRYYMVDILTVGWSALQTLRNQNFGLVMHAHRAGHAAVTRNHKHGISMLTIAKIARLIGVDQLHVGTAVGKMEGSAAEVSEIENEVEGDVIVPKKKMHVLEQDWYGMKPVLAVSSGGLHPGHVEPLLKIMGNNIVCQFGGGCHGHPEGTTAGAKAIRQAIDASMKGIPARKYAKDHHELKLAFDKWM